LPENHIRDAVGLLTPGAGARATDLSTAPARDARSRADILAVLAAAAYFFVFADLVDGAVTGSRTTCLIVAPVLMATIALGGRIPLPGNSGSDQVTELVLGTTGFTAIKLLCGRVPAVAASWGLALSNVMVWAACAVAVLFSARHVVRLWPLWAFGLSCAAPFPYLVALDGFGGSNWAAVLLTGSAAALAVHLAAQRMPIGVRPAAAMYCATVAVAGVLTVGGRAGLSFDEYAAGALLPLAVVIWTWVADRRRSRPPQPEFVDTPR
jgi:hypothetical protein